MRGRPPLGPGTTPAARLAAFYAAMVDLLEQHLPLVLGAENGASRFAVGAYGFWRGHVCALLRDAQAPDPDTLADALLAPLSPEVYRHQREGGATPQQIAASLQWQAHRLLGRAPRRPR